VTLAPVVRAAAPWAAALSLVSAGCGGGGREEAELHARLSVLEREVEGQREVAARLERGEPALPMEDVIVALDESLVKELVEAQLPFEAEVESYRLWLDRAEVRFRGSPGVTLSGGIALKDRPNLSGQARVIGALENIAVNPGTGVLEASIAVDHLDLIEVAGIQGFLGGGVLNELARQGRLWVAVHVVPGELSKREAPPDAQPALAPQEVAQ
jgi:hypothetical protein